MVYLRNYLDAILFKNVQELFKSNSSLIVVLLVKYFSIKFYLLLFKNKAVTLPELFINSIENLFKLNKFKENSCLVNLKLSFQYNF